MLIVVLCLTTSAMAVTLHVTVLYETTGNPAPFAKVKVFLPESPEDFLGMETNENGQCSFPNLQAGTLYTIEVNVCGIVRSFYYHTQEYSNSEESITVSCGVEWIVTPSLLLAYTEGNETSMAKMPVILEERKKFKLTA